MTLQDMAQQCLKDSERWFPGIAKDLGHHALALGGEVGEFQNLVKKIQRGSLQMKDAKTRNDLAMELTDVLIYVLNLAGLMGVDLEKAYAIKRVENEQRFGTAAQNGKRS